MQTPQLITINGKNTIDFINVFDIDDCEIQEISLDKMLPWFNTIFSSFVSKFQNENSGILKKFHGDFQDWINAQAKAWTDSSQGAANFIIAKNWMRSQFEVMSFFYDNMVKNDKLLNCADRQEMSESILANMNKTVNGLVRIIESLGIKITKMMTVYRRELEISLMWINEYKGVNGNMNMNMNYSLEASVLSENKSNKKHADEKEDYICKIEKLEKDNKAMAELLMKYNNTLDKKVENKEVHDTNNNNNNNNNNTSHYTHFKSSKLETSKNILETSQMSQSSILGNTSNSNITASPFKKLDMGNAKLWSLKSLKDWINEIYQSKILYDKKCHEYNLPRETMEQHMYNYLNTKYGWKTIVIETVSSIILSVKHHSADDSEVLLFGRIIRNEQEEDSWLVLEKLKSTIDDLLEYSIRSKYPLKSNADVTKEKKAKMLGTLSHSEWKGILSSLHSNNVYDSIKTNIIAIIKEENEERKRRILSNEKAGMSREGISKAEKNEDALNISFTRFAQVVMKYQVMYRDKYLRNFRRIFRKIDEDRDGVVSEEGFLRLLDEIGVDKFREKKAQKTLLKKADPTNFNKISFSDCVALFANEVVEEDSSDISLDKSVTGRNGNPVITWSWLDKICWECDK